MPKHAGAELTQLVTSSCASCRGSSWCCSICSCLPPLLAKTVFREFFIKMGFIRYMMLSCCCCSWLRCPSRWCCAGAFNLKYIVAIPEYFLNF